MMGKPNSGMARGELRSTLSRAGPCRSSATTTMKADGGKNPRSAPVKFNEKDYGGRKAESAYENSAPREFRSMTR